MKVGPAALFRQGRGLHWPLSFKIKIKFRNLTPRTKTHIVLLHVSLCGANIPYKKQENFGNVVLFALNITDEAGSRTISLSDIHPDLIKRFTCAFPCFHLMHESHCFSFSERVEGSKKSSLVSLACYANVQHLLTVSVCLVFTVDQSPKNIQPCNNYM